MDSAQFDDLMRDGIGTRRLLLLMAGGAIGGVITRLGLGEDAEAKSRKHGERHDDHKRQGHVQAAGKKHRGNGKHKKKDKDKPRQCPTGFRRCSDGTCLSTQPGVCCLDEEFCPGGGCRPQNGCCPGSKKCNGQCAPIGKGGCCPEEKVCGLECIPKSECCDLSVPVCVACQDPVCKSSGDWECRSRCLDDEACRNDQCVLSCDNGCVLDGSGECTVAPAGKVYCEGQDICVPACPDGQDLDSATCQCNPVICPDGSPDFCIGDFSPWKCGDHPNCYCLKTTAGATACADLPYHYQGLVCQTDSDCDVIWGPNMAVCGQCKHRCHHKCMT